MTAHDSLRHENSAAHKISVLPRMRTQSHMNSQSFLVARWQNMPLSSLNWHGQALRCPVEIIADEDACTASPLASELNALLVTDNAQTC